MRRPSTLRSLLASAALPALLVTGCGSSINRNGPPGNNQGSPDLAKVIVFDDAGGTPDVDMSTDDGPPPLPGIDVCGDNPADVNCQAFSKGPPNNPFPLSTDQNKDPLEKDNGVNRDANGFLALDSTHSVFNYLWIANASDNNSAGSVSKIDSKTVREVARYFTVTCYSSKAGSTDACDGTKGCCSIDDWQRYQARKAHMNQMGHQAVQRTLNYPSRTSVDFNGDLFISNRAFGGQSSVTKIANDVSECIDRNRNGRIDTSKDTNGDGFIQEDCNGDGVPDNIGGVKAKPCKNNLPQEFYGEDDECILWTSNTFVANAVGRPLGLAAGANDSNVSDAWAGSYQNGNFIRIDGTTGLGKDDTQLPQECYGGTGPYGLAVDAQGIGWTPDLGNGKLCYFDTKNSKNVGSVRDPQWGSMQGYGITLDRDQNVWVGSGVERYTPDRSNGFKNLGNGWWTKITGRFGIGIAADSRNANAYFVYSCSGGDVLQIPASTIKLAKMDQQVAPNGWASITMPCYGVGVDADQNVWGVNMQTTTRALVDKNGKITQPNVNGAAMGNNVCPKGDSCPNAGAYTYSDFTGFGLRNFTRPQGNYQYVVKGCTDVQGNPQDTQWFQIQWDADMPPNTTLIVHAKSGHSTNLTDGSWMVNPWTPDMNVSPVNLQTFLSPNAQPGGGQQVVNDEYLLVEFVFKTQSQNASPKLKSFDVGFKCNSGPG